MTNGEVTYYDEDGGFGFIECDEKDDDVFVHMADLDDDEPELEEGETLWFDIEEAEKGPRATNVSRTEDYE